MAQQSAYKAVLTQAAALPPHDLSKLVGELSLLLTRKYGKWADLNTVEEVGEYVEWLRFRDSHRADGSRKSPEEFLAELGAEE